MADINQTGYDRIYLGRANEQELIDNKDKIRSNELVIAKDSHRAFHKGEDGTLNKIVSNYTFDTIADLQNADYLVEGDIVEVLGYYEKGDGAEHKRKIEATNDCSGILLSNTLFANIQNKDKVNVKFLGAKGDGVNDTEAFSKGQGMNLYVPAGNYHIYASLNLPILVGESTNNSIITLMEGYNLLINENIELLHHEELTIVKVGDKTTIDSSSTIMDIVDNMSICNTVKIKNVSIVCLTDINDEDSWIDNTNKSRMGSTYRISSTDITVNKLYVYGVSSALVIYDNGINKGNCIIENCKGYNTETFLYGNGTFETINMNNCHIINDVITQSYWIRMNTGTGKNGKSLFLWGPGGATHKCNITNCSTRYSIERSIYYQGNNGSICNVVDISPGAGGAMAKVVLDDGTLAYNNGLSNIRVYDYSGNNNIQIYGQKNYILDNFYYNNNTDTSTNGWSIHLSRYNNNLLIKNGYIENSRVCIMIADINTTLKNVVFNDIYCRNIYSGSSREFSLLQHYDIDSNVSPSIDSLVMSNIQVEDDNEETNDINKGLLNLKKMNDVLINNVKGKFSRYPFDTTGSTNVIINKCEFLYDSGTSALDVACDRFDINEISANISDFKIKLAKKRSLELGYSFDFYFYNQNNTGLKKCWDSLKEMNLQIAVKSTDTLYRKISNSKFLGYKIKSEFNGARFEGYIDRLTYTITETLNIGNIFSMTDDSTMIRIYFVDENLTIRKINAIGEDGELNFKLYK